LVLPESVLASELPKMESELELLGLASELAPELALLELALLGLGLA
jgi:hypothetical protein